MVDFEFLYGHLVERIKNKINYIYQDEYDSDEIKELYEKAAYGLFLCLDMMRTDVMVWGNNKELKGLGLDFDPLEKYESGTMFEGLDDVDNLDDEEDN